MLILMLMVMLILTGACGADAENIYVPLWLISIWHIEYVMAEADIVILNKVCDIIDVSFIQKIYLAL